jgi:hypothetical protein
MQSKRRARAPNLLFLGQRSHPNAPVDFFDFLEALVMKEEEV